MISDQEVDQSGEVNRSRTGHDHDDHHRYHLDEKLCWIRGYTTQKRRVCEFVSISTLTGSETDAFPLVDLGSRTLIHRLVSTLLHAVVLTRDSPHPRVFAWCFAYPRS